MFLSQREDVKNIITRYKNNRNIKFLCAVPNGSRVYGYPSINSDIDVRGIYVEPLNNYLKLERSKDCFSSNFYGNDLEIDLQMYSLDKALKLIF